MKMIIPLKRSRFLLFVTSILLCLGATVFLAGCDDDDDLADTRLDLQLFADGFVSPIGLVASPDNTNRLFVIDQVGKIWILEANGTRVPTPFLDLSATMISLNAN